MIIIYFIKVGHAFCDKISLKLHILLFMLFCFTRVIHIFSCKNGNFVIGKAMIPRECDIIAIIYSLQ